MLEEVEEALETEAKEAVETKPAAVQPQHALAELVSAGLTFLNKLGEAIEASTQGTLAAVRSGQSSPLDIVQSLIEKDDASRTYLKLPAPTADTLRKVADILYKLSGK
jgi:hypothetical protein